MGVAYISREHVAQVGPRIDTFLEIVGEFGARVAILLVALVPEPDDFGISVGTEAGE